MSGFSCKLDVFEGPLDLLISLIQKNKLNIYDIKILDLVDQYISYIKQAQDQQLYIASEFLEMAARLVYIKSVCLLPKPNESEKLKEELQGALIEYQLCKDISKILATRANYDMYTRFPEKFSNISFPYTLVHSSQLLPEAYLSAFNKKSIKTNPPKEEVFFSSVKRQIVSVASRAKLILFRFHKSKEITFMELFDDCHNKSDCIATFLAILGLIKDKRIHIHKGNTHHSVLKLDTNGENKNG